MSVYVCTIKENYTEKVSGKKKKKKKKKKTKQKHRKICFKFHIFKRKRHHENLSADVVLKQK